MAMADPEKPWGNIPAPQLSSQPKKANPLNFTEKFKIDGVRAAKIKLNGGAKWAHKVAYVHSKREKTWFALFHDEFKRTEVDEGSWIEPDVEPILRGIDENGNLDTAVIWGQAHIDAEKAEAESRKRKRGDSAVWNEDGEEGEEGEEEDGDSDDSCPELVVPEPSSEPAKKKRKLGSRERRQMKGIEGAPPAAKQAEEPKASEPAAEAKKGKKEKKEKKGTKAAAQPEATEEARPKEKKERAGDNLQEAALGAALRKKKKNKKN